MTPAPQAPGVTWEAVEAFADRIESAGRVYGYAVAHDLRALLCRTEFDRWLAAHDAEVAERAWDEGHAAADGRVSLDKVLGRWAINPYRNQNTQLGGH